MTVGELFIKLGADVDNASLDSFKGSIENLPAKLINLKNVFIGALVYGVDQFVESTIKGTVALQNFQNQTDLSIDKLQKWQVAGQLANTELNTDQITASIQNLQKNLTDIRFGGGNIRGFQMLGIDVQGKEAFQVLEDIREAIKGVDNAAAVNIIESMGIDKGFINILRESKKEFDSFGKMKFLNQGQREKLIKLGEGITHLKIQMGLLKDAIVAGLMPVWESLFSILNNFANIFQDIIRLLGEGIEWLLKHKVLLASLAIVLGILVAWMYPLQAAIIAIILLIEDLYVYFKGGKSVIGDFITWVSKLWDELVKGHPWIQKVVDWFKWLGNYLATGLKADFEFAKKLFSVFWDLIGGGFDMNNLKKSFINLKNLLYDSFVLPMKEAIKDYKEMFDFFKNNSLFQKFFGSKNKELNVEGSLSKELNVEGSLSSENQQKNINPLDLLNTQKAAENTLKPASTIQNNSPVSNKTTSFNNSFNIQSAGNPQDVAQSVIDIQQRQFNYSYQELNNGAAI